jgi:hypothetical protein
MAAILYFLLTTLKAEWKSEFTICWFPYTQKDQKEFKQIAYTLIQKMQSSGTVIFSLFLNSYIEYRFLQELYWGKAY